MFALHKPKVYQKLVEEIRGAFNKYKDITPEALADLPYLHAVLMESLCITVTGGYRLPRVSPGAMVERTLYSQRRPSAVHLPGFYVSILSRATSLSTWALATQRAPILGRGFQGRCSKGLVPVQPGSEIMYRKITGLERDAPIHLQDALELWCGYATPPATDWFWQRLQNARQVGEAWFLSLLPPGRSGRVILQLKLLFWMCAEVVFFFTTPTRSSLGFALCRCTILTAVHMQLAGPRQSMLWFKL